MTSIRQANLSLPVAPKKAIVEDGAVHFSLHMHTETGQAVSTSPQIGHPRYRRDIDGLRAVAVIGVLVFHAFPTMLPGGFIGVDVFFVISGFLISMIIFKDLERDKHSLANFYVRRIRRIFPALILVLVACFAIGRFVLPLDQFQQLGKHAAASAGFIQNFVLWSESGYFDTAAESKPLLHLWSLAVEEQFYIVWPLLLSTAWKRGWGFLQVAGAISILSFALGIYLVHDDPAAAFYLPVSRFWELALGGILAFMLLHKAEWLAGYRNQQSIAGFLLLLLGFLLLSEARDFPGWWALLPTLGAFLIISAEGSWLNEKLLANQGMVWIGLISYPLYLWHWPLLAYVNIVEGEISPLFGLSALGLAVVLAWLTYEYVEKPFRFGRRSPAKIAVLACTMGLMGLLGVRSFQLDESHGRPPVEMALVAGNAVQLPGTDGVAAAAPAPATFRPAKYDFAGNYRLGKCFLTGRGKERYAEACDGDPGRSPTIVVWGDSHAASIFPGLLKKSIAQGFNLAQYTTSGCPPVIDFTVDNRKGCRDLNAGVLERIRATKPDTVVLAAYWLLYDGKHDESGKPWNVLKEDQIARTLEALQSAGVRQVVIVGQVPTFVKSQVDIGMVEFVPGAVNRTYSGYVHESGSADRRIRRIARDSKVAFISPIDALCDDSGCLISTSLQTFKPLAWDYGHFTTDGSELFIEAAVRNQGLNLMGRGSAP